MEKLTDKQKNISITAIILLLTAGLICGIAINIQKNNKGANNNFVNENLIYENTISPNKNFVEKEEDKVFYTIKIYQNNNEIRVAANSNSAFTKNISYQIESDKKITKNDINIEWQTITGDTNFTEENQIAVAVISIYSNGKMISQRKVDFISKAIDIVVETINKNK